MRAEDPDVKEAAITAVFVPILNSVIAELKRCDTRVTVDCQNFHIPTRDGGTLKPDVFLWGKGSPAFSPVDGTPSKTQSKRSRELRAVYNGRSPDEDGPPIDWPWCLIPIEVKTDLSRGGRDSVLAHNQLGT